MEPASIFDLTGRSADSLQSEREAESNVIHREQKISDKADDLRIYEEARARVKEERAAADYTEPLFEDFEELGASVKDVPKFRIDGLMLSNADMLVVGAHKAGKTTFMLNLIRSLATGEPFLGCYEVQPVAGRILFMNYELPRVLLHEWLEKIDIPNEKLVTVSPLGGSNPLASEYGRERLAEQMDKREVEILIVDPFAAAVTGLDISEQDNSAVRQFLEQISRVRASTRYCSEAILTHHSGKDKEKGARGASAFFDWPSSYLELNRRGTQFDSPRELKANGRDVGLRSTELIYNPETHRMILAKDQRAVSVESQANEVNNELIDAIVEVVNESNRMLSSQEVEAELKAKGVTFRKEQIKPAREAAVNKGLIQGNLGKYKTSVAPISLVNPADLTL